MVKELATGPAAPPAAQFYRRNRHSSVVVNDYVYIVGGAVSQNVNDRTVVYAISDTVALPLGSSWNNQTVQPIIVNQTEAVPRTYNPALWPDEESNGFYMLASAPAWVLLTNSAKKDQFNLDQFWKFTADSNGGGTYDSRQIPEGGVIHSTYGSKASEPGMGYYIGGEQSTVQQVISTTYGGERLNRMQLFDWKSNTVKNATLPPLFTFPSFDESQTIPDYGPDGLLIWIQPSVTGLDVVFIWDKSTDTWHRQPATGDIPKPRDSFCTVGAKSTTGTFEIFIYGGFDMDALPPVSEDVYVLSLPGFVWKRVTPDASTARYQHTCEVVGNRQILSIGGSSATVNDPILGFADKDPNAQGLAVFDMTDLEWKTSYDAKAAPYVSADVVQQWYEDAGPGSVDWSSDQVRSLFPQDVLDKYDLNPSDDNGLSGGVIAGVIIAIFALLAIGSGMVWWFLRRRAGRGRSLSQSDDWAKAELAATPTTSISSHALLKPIELDAVEPTHELGDTSHVAELSTDDTKKYELPSPNATPRPEKAHHRFAEQQTTMQIQYIRDLDVDDESPPGVQKPGQTHSQEYFELPT